MAATGLEFAAVPHGPRDGQVAAPEQMSWGRAVQQGCEVAADHTVPPDVPCLPSI